MPQAVTHILVPILLVSLIRDYILSRNAKVHFPLHYVLIAGLGGVLPDIDIVISVFLKIIGSSDWWIHKTFTHSLLFPLTFLFLFLILRPFHMRARLCTLGRHKLQLHLIALMLAFGTLMHSVLDMFAGEAAYLFYPFSMYDYGINLFAFSGLGHGTTAALLDGVLLVIWIVYLEAQHRISDFI